MERSFFNVSDFANYSSKLRKNESHFAMESMAYDNACGRQTEYGVFISHSTKDIELIGKVRAYIEETLGVSAYIDWEEDEGMTRDEVADTVKEAMRISKKFLIVKTENSDMSSWVSWETGFFDNKDANSIGVLLVEKNDFSYADYENADFTHQEYLKNYKILSKEDLQYFLDGGIKAVLKFQTERLNNNFENKKIGISTAGGTVGLKYVEGTGSSTKYFGDE